MMETSSALECTQISARAFLLAFVYGVLESADVTSVRFKESSGNFQELENILQSVMIYQDAPEQMLVLHVDAQ